MISVVGVPGVSVVPTVANIPLTALIKKKIKFSSWTSFKVIYD